MEFWLGVVSGFLAAAILAAVCLRDLGWRITMPGPMNQCRHGRFAPDVPCVICASKSDPVSKPDEWKAVACACGGTDFRREPRAQVFVERVGLQNLNMQFGDALVCVKCGKDLESPAEIVSRLKAEA